MLLTREEACRFLLWYQELLLPCRLTGREGVLSWLNRTRALQSDPVNVVGRSPDLTLRARVGDYRPEMLTGLLYRERLLVEHFDKEFCVFPAEDWSLLGYRRQGYLEWSRGRQREGQLFAHHETVLAAVRDRGALSPAELELAGTVDWYWGPAAKLSRAVLDHMFYGGLLAIHSRKGHRKYYELPERVLPAEALSASSVPSGDGLTEWQVMRRIGSVGLLWNRSGSAWLGLPGAPQRQKALDALVSRGELCPLTVEGIKQPFYVRTADWNRFAESEIPEPDPADGVFLAPLDNLLWDREMIRQLFGFDYVWEIYKPAEKRKWGYYVLPLLAGGRLIGRAEPVYNRDTGRLELKNSWFEREAPPGAVRKRALRRAVRALESMLNDKEGKSRG